MGKVCLQNEEQYAFEISLLLMWLEEHFLPAFVQGQEFYLQALLNISHKCSYHLSALVLDMLCCWLSERQV